jgi:hypothetical protein
MDGRTGGWKGVTMDEQTSIRVRSIALTMLGACPIQSSGQGRRAGQAGKAGCRPQLEVCSCRCSNMQVPESSRSFPGQMNGGTCCP